MHPRTRKSFNLKIDRTNRGLYNRIVGADAPFAEYENEDEML
jgi:hypothetical protein